MGNFVATQQKAVAQDAAHKLKAVGGPLGDQGKAEFYWVMYTPTPWKVTDEMKKLMIDNCGKVLPIDPSLELKNPSGWQVHQINGSESLCGKSEF